tara:strand:- start:287 stop:1039 length:753 start_codon:yes stop_codon:yes gene_type:complete
MISKFDKNLKLNYTIDYWLTNIFKYKVGNVTCGQEENLTKLINEEKEIFLYSKVPVKNISFVNELYKFGFIPIETSLNFEGSIISKSDNDDLNNIRFANTNDKDSVEKLAFKNFIYSRFHMDPFISLKTANKIKSVWASNFFLGKRGDKMIVSEVDSKIVGFLQLFWNKKGQIVIDLIGVDQSYHRRGLARKMIIFASLNLKIQNIDLPLNFIVGTQAINVPSIKLYQSLGLRMTNAEFVLHYHKNKNKL